MGKSTGIEWTDTTWNPIRGCSRVSEGCRNCYAESMAHRFSGPGQPYAGLTQIVNGHPAWTGKVEFVEKHLLDPLKWKPVWEEWGSLAAFGQVYKWQRPRRIFVNSMSDLFHENIPDEWIDRIFAVMALCPQHTFQVLTKRPERMRAYLSNPGVRRAIATEANIFMRSNRRAGGSAALSNLFLWGALHNAALGEYANYLAGIADDHWPLPNVHLGASVEDQKMADTRIPMLLQTPAAVRFISAEPLLGPICFHNRLYKDASQTVCCGDCSGVGVPVVPSPGWVIVGGESGPGARPMHTEWAQQIVDQCKAANVPVFVKQLGVHVIQGGERRIKRDRKGKDMHEWPHELRVREFPR